MIKGKNWTEVADQQMETVFTMTDKDDTDIRKMADLYSDDLAEDVLDPLSQSVFDAVDKEGEFEDL